MKTELLKYFTFLGLLLFLSSYSAQVQARPQHSLGAKTGLINYTVQGLANTSASNTLNYTVEWNFFVNTASAVVVGYRSATSQEYSRSLFQETYLATRIFPMSLGVPIQTNIATSTVNYRFAFKPYLDAGAAFGRFSVPFVSKEVDTSVFEIASEYIGLFGGGGFFYEVWGNLNLDMSFTFESMTGFNSPTAFDGTAMYILFGFSYSL
jgi:hypothetical protein